MEPNKGGKPDRKCWGLGGRRQQFKREWPEEAAEVVENREGDEEDSHADILIKNSLGRGNGKYMV